jgi:hypothetical protein
MHELVSNELKQIYIDITKCIENSTDGAPNMQGQYKGFTKWLADDSPKQLVCMVLCTRTKFGYIGCNSEN